MKKIYKLVDLDCAECAGKMERKISKISGVKNCSVNFLLQKLTIEADDANFENIMDSVVKECKRIEPDCKIVR